MGLPLDEHDRRLIASVLMDEHEELTPELLENAVRSLRRRAILRQLDDLQHQLKDAERRNDAAHVRPPAAGAGQAAAGHGSIGETAGLSS